PLGPHPSDRAGPGNPPHRRCALSEARQDRRAGRRHLQRGVRDAEQVAASPRALLDRPDPVSALRISGQVGPKQDRQPKNLKILPKKAHRDRISGSGAFLCFLCGKTPTSQNGTYLWAPLYRFVAEDLNMLVERGL